MHGHDDDSAPPPRAREEPGAPGVGDDEPGWRWYVAHTPGAVAVVAGAEHRVLAANAAFGRVACDDATMAVAVGLPMAQVCAPAGAPVLCMLLDRVRRTGEAADALIPGADAEHADAWHCTAWPASDDRATGTTVGVAPHAARGAATAFAGALVLEARAAGAAERVAAQAAAWQRDVAERMLLGALHDQQLADAAEVARIAAERREAELAAVIESLPDAVYLSTRGRITRANQAALAQLGIATLDLVPGHEAGAAPPSGVALRDADTGMPVAVERQPLARALGGATVIEEGLLRHPTSGDDRTVRCVAAPVVVDGHVVAAVVVHTDVTAQRRLEAALRQAQQLEAVGRLAGGIAHDFNNLLAAIGGNVELAAAALPDASPARADLHEVSDAVARAASLTRQLLAFGRRQVLRPETLDVGVVVTDVQRLLARTLGGAVVLTTRLDPTCPPVVADRSQLEQVVMNLAVNARDAMPGGGTLIIETRWVDRLPAGVLPIGVPPAGVPPAAGTSPGDGGEGEERAGWVALTVRDTGVGMDPATRARIFEPFFTTKGIGQGTGLGLATVYGIVMQSGGHIDLATEPGRGTAFTVYLPAERSGASGPAAGQGTGAPAAPAVVEPPRGAGTILLVDDEPAVRRVVGRLLARRGYAVLEAGDGAEALAVAAQHARQARHAGTGPIRALITDVRMPGMSGPDLADRLRATCPDLPVLLISGYTADTPTDPTARPHARHGTTRLGARVGFLEKPFASDALAAALQALLDDGDATS